MVVCNKLPLSCEISKIIAGSMGNPDVAVLLDNQLCQAGYLKVSNVGLPEIMIIIGLIVHQ